ncbi:MAG: hypothetical protein GY793_10580, partial [Proteobacteria bacterium]|nr:hypothetical protein [Pseudomonadota bacterium]
MASEYNEKLSGKVAIQFKAVLGTLVVGAGTTPLTGDAWYKIAAKAASGSTLPLEIDYYFKTPATGQTPTVGDDVYPVTWEKICKADTSFSGAKGAIDVTDDCDEGYNTYITDGFS